MTDDKPREDASERLLKEKGPQMLEMIRQSLREDNLTSKERQELEKTASMLAGYQLSFWLPTTITRKALMFLFLIIGVFGTLWWSPWFALLVVFGCLFSPRIVGELSVFIGRLSK